MMEVGIDEVFKLKVNDFESSNLLIEGCGKHKPMMHNAAIYRNYKFILQGKL